MKLTPMQKKAIQSPWNAQTRSLRPVMDRLPGGLTVGLSVNQ